MNADSQLRRQEARALAELGMSELSKASSGLHQTHRAVSDRVFSLIRRGVGSAVLPVQAVHDGITDGVYRIVEESTATAAMVGRMAADVPIDRPVSSTTRGAALIGVVNGLIGDELDSRQSPLTEHNLSIRVAGRHIPVTSADLAAAFPRPTRRLAVFVHGLTETEHAWRLGQRTTAPYEHLLWANGVTSVFLRYNTGRRISTNGQDLAELLDDLVRFWPEKVDELSLIGHSMGGLVLRSAAHYGHAADHVWTPRVRCSISLGTPHLGAPLENLAHHASALLVTRAETEAFGRLLRRRSGGIRDLRAGSLVDRDWQGRDPDDLAAAFADEIPLLPGAEHYFVSATVSRDPRHRLGRILGDGLVLHHSAGGRSTTRNIGFAPENGLHIGRAHHLSLLNHRVVGKQLAGWVG